MGKSHCVVLCCNEELQDKRRILQAASYWESVLRVVPVEDTIEIKDNLEGNHLDLAEGILVLHFLRTSRISY